MRAGLACWQSVGFTMSWFFKLNLALSKQLIRFPSAGSGNATPSKWLLNGELNGVCCLLGALL